MATMDINKIIDLFDPKIHRRIEEVIKVDQTNEEDVYQEISEYIVTESIRDEYIKVLDAYAESATRATEGIGVWVSGFFGSGKSSFAKILGFILEGRKVLGQSSADLFCQRANDDRIRALLNTIHAHAPTYSCIFDISSARTVRSGSEKITEIMYKALLRSLGYSDDLDIAQLEIDLERDNRLDIFIAAYEKRYGQSWNQRKKLIAIVLNEASAVLHELDPQTYPEVDTWARTPKHADISPDTFADTAFEILERREPGKRLTFIIDEVGQYVSRSTDKMLDLMGIIHAFGKKGKGKAWIVVTSQEKLDEIVDYLEGKRIELARLQDRFPIHVDLSPADISEVATKRVLTKKPSGEEQIKTLYEKNVDSLKTHTNLRSQLPPTTLDTTSFSKMYPFLPYQIDLIIDIVSGIRTQPGATRHTGGSNRTIIKHAWEMVHRLQDESPGQLVTLDQTYDLLEGNISYEKRKDIVDIQSTYADDPIVGKVAKTVCLLGFVRRVPRDDKNIAATLYPEVGHASVLPQVKKAIERLLEDRAIKLGDYGYELLSVEGKRWEDERRGIDIKPAERKRIQKDIIEEVLSIKPYRHMNLRNFNPTISMNGERISKEGDVLVPLALAEDGEEYRAACQEARSQSQENENAIFWVVPILDEFSNYVKEIHRSSQMILRHEREIKSREEGKLVADEKTTLSGAKRKTITILKKAFESGNTYFRGVERTASSLGENVHGAFHGIMSIAIPQLYPNLKDAAVQVTGKEPEQILTSGDLRALPSVYYEGGDGLGLVTKQADRFVINTDSKPAKEILSFIHSRHSYGEKASGKLLEHQFSGIGYGWELDVIRIIVAALFRGNAIEVSHQGRRFRSATDPSVRDVFSKIPPFRAAAFTPREGVDIKMLAKAARVYEDLFGEEVNVEEGSIAEAAKQKLIGERDYLIPLQAKLSAHHLPRADYLNELIETLKGILAGTSEDLIKILAGEGISLKESLDDANKMSKACTDSTLEILTNARELINYAGAEIDRLMDTDVSIKDAKERLEENLNATTFFERIPEIVQDATSLQQAYQRRFEETHGRRNKHYEKALEVLRGHHDWQILGDEERHQILKPITQRVCRQLQVQGGYCATCKATIAQMESDVAALDSIMREIRAKVEQMTKPEEKFIRIKVADFFTKSLETRQEIEDSLQNLRDHLFKLLEEGKKIILE